MHPFLRSPRTGVGVLAIALTVALAAACGKSDDAPRNDIRLATNATLGQFLTDQAGKTLYVFSPDVRGTSACASAQCLAAWPVFFKEAPTLDAGLNAADFATITRADGAKQTTFKGWPLYYYAQDVAEGDVKGENVNGRWFVARDYTVMLAAQGSRLYLSDITGRTLYLFTRDTPGTSTSACTSAQCLGAWPVFSVSNVVAPSSLRATDFRTFDRADGKKQLAYKGWPLYYYTPDAARGDTTGGGVGRVWYTIAP